MLGNSQMARTGKKQGRTGVQQFFITGSIGEVPPYLKLASYIVLILATLVSILPFFYIITTSFKESRFLFSYPPQWLPKHIYWGNYAHLIFNTDSLRWLFNTLFVSLTVTAIKLVFDSMAGYAFAKLYIPGKEILFTVVIATLMIPFSAILIPLYFLVRELGMLNSYWALILPPLANPIGIFMMRGFIQLLPNDLENAARLDGVSEFGIYRRIILPLIKPALVTLGVLTFSLQYTSFLWPLTSVSSSSLQVITTGLATQRGITDINYGVFSAGAVLAMIPIVLFFLAIQKQWITASLAGALKQ